MNSRDTTLATIRKSLGKAGDDPARVAAVKERLEGTPTGVIPERGRLEPAARVDLFQEMAEYVSASVTRVENAADVPDAIAAFLRERNLPQSLIHGGDEWIAGLPWDRQPNMERKQGRADGSEHVGFSRAVAGVAETGTLLLYSGVANPTTINFLPEVHVVAIDAADIESDYEAAWARLRERFGKGILPRTVNMVTGPSRSADIEQTLLLGAHGPRRLHILIIGG